MTWPAFADAVEYYVAFPSGTATTVASYLNGMPVPAGATWVEVTATNTIAGGTNKGVEYIISFDNASGTGIGNVNATVASGASLTSLFAVPAGSVYWQVEAGTVPSPPHTTNVFTINSLNFYCGGAPGNQQAACCPPDPNTIGMLTNILGLITLIQRQIAPFAYVQGTPIPGLTGDGTISVQGLLGALIEITSATTVLSQYAGDPTHLAGAGWINWGNADGWAEREWIGSASQVSFPSAAGQYTLIGYSLGNATVTITPLVREP